MSKKLLVLAVVLGFTGLAFAEDAPAGNAPAAAVAPVLLWMSPASFGRATRKRSARTVPATSSFACGVLVPIPRLPASVRRICSWSFPAKKSPRRKLKAPRPLIICPSVPSLANKVGVCGSSFATFATFFSRSTQRAPSL